MIMMCWFYCIPFAKGFFFAAGPLMFLLALFVLKRGVRQSRRGLRQLAFIFITVALAKICTVDIYLLKASITCAFNNCHDGGLFRMIQAAGLGVLILGCLFLFNLYRSFANDRRQHAITPDQVHLSFWGNLSISLVLLLIFWLAAPWAGFLTVGHVPQFFMEVPWQNLALANIVVLLIGFWKLEDCIGTYNPKDKVKNSYQTSVWTAKDTLWVSVVLFVIALAFSYASNDVLSVNMPKENSHLNVDWDSINLDFIGPGFQKPEEYRGPR
jgi:hypothetical protein